MPKISVIMGVYNCKNRNLLETSIDSIIAQTYKDWEFIICNDGSTDDTLEILHTLEKKDSRIKVISYDKNHGLNYALNECLKVARGAFIARQDDDDISYPQRFEKELQFLNENPECGFVGCIADVYDDAGVWGEYLVEERPTKKSFLWNSPFMHPTIMVRKKVYDSVNGYRIAKETRRCEDLDLFMRMYSKGIYGYNIQEKLYKYRLVNDPQKKYRPMKYRVDEAIVRYKGYKKLEIGVVGIPYIIKPILVGIIPQKLLYKIKKKRY